MAVPRATRASQRAWRSVFGSWRRLTKFAEEMRIIVGDLRRRAGNENEISLDEELVKASGFWKSRWRMPVIVPGTTENSSSTEHTLSMKTGFPDDVHAWPIALFRLWTSDGVVIDFMSTPRVLYSSPSD